MLFFIYIFYYQKVDIVLMGQLVDQLVNGTSPQRILTEGVEYRALPGDTSNLMSYSGDFYKVENANLFFFPLYANYAYHVSIADANRMECDDFFIDNGYTNAGAWQYYIR